MNATLVKQALEKVLNPNILVNLVSRRVRQLNSGGGTRQSAAHRQRRQSRRRGHCLARNRRGKNGLGNARNHRTHPSDRKAPQAASVLGKELAKESNTVCNVLEEFNQVMGSQTFQDYR